ncbi:glycosyltransferase [candidate division CSSED10-310 bacterium]|uniref:Glycosyltransferase n=1 Tax=candidate division CSSED10-310 bacterium TaxID=2855610 RepID=A0ABV6YWK7_UNCC1
MNVIFTGLNGYSYPYTRVRCYNFARAVSTHSINSEVLSFKDHFKPELTEEQLFSSSDRFKLLLSFRFLKFLMKRSGSVIYLQKIHYHAAMPVFLARLGYISLILDLDDWEENCFCLFKRSWLNRLFLGGTDYADIVAKTAEIAHFCVAASHSLSRILLRHNDNVFLIHTGVDAEKFTFCDRPPRAGITCGWTGLVWSETILNSLLLLIDCFSSAYRQEERLQLVIIGAGLKMPELKQIVKAKYSHLPIEIKDWIHPDEMNTELHQFDIGLLPFAPDKKNRIWLESKSPTKLFEYMATGLPTVASDVGEGSIVLQNSEAGFIIADKSDFVERLLLLARNEKLRLKMGRKARKIVEQKYSLKVLGERLALYFKKYI